MSRQSNPLLVHRTRSATGNVLDGWREGHEVLNDGFFLAQRSGDASRVPLVLKQGEIIPTQNFSMSDIYLGEPARIFIVAAPSIPGALPDIGNSATFRLAYEEGSGVEEGTQTIEGPMFVLFQSGHKEGDIILHDDPRITFTLPSGHLFTVCLRPNQSLPTNGINYLAYWIAEDGSTYWANAAKTYGTTLSAVFDRDAWYSVRWASDNLARAAFASLGVSPAVNAGSKDWLNGGFTNTFTQIVNNGSMDFWIYSQADNIPPVEMGGYDNYDRNVTGPVPWESEGAMTNGAGDDLDIGYHYGAACYTVTELGQNSQFTVDPDNIAFAVTLRHPKEAVGTMPYEIENQTYNIAPDITAYRKLAIASGTYQGETKTIACFSSPMTEVGNCNYSLVMYKIFRGDTTSYGCAAQDMSEEADHIDSKIAMTAGSGAEYSTMSEPIYLAAGFIRAYNTPESHKQSIIDVYRYEPTGDPDVWIHIGTCTMGGTDTSVLMDISLAASGNDLSVFWLYDKYVYPGYKREIWGYKIADAATRTTSQNFAPSIPIYYEISGNTIGLTINTDQDGQGDNTVRITWTEKLSGQNQKYRSHAGNVVYLSGQPNSISPYEDLSYSVEADMVYPIIAINQSNYRDNLAFCQYGYDHQSSGNLSRRDLSSGVWQPPVNRAETGLEYSATSMTYRYFGTPRQIWRYGGTTLRTEHDDVCNFPYYAPVIVKIVTDRSNRMDIFATYGYYNDNICLIQQLEP